MTCEAMRRWGYFLTTVAFALIGAICLVGCSKSPEVSTAKLPEIKLLLDMGEVEHSKNPDLAKYEPLTGCYLGAYLDLEPKIKETFVDSNGGIRKLPKKFEDAVKKEHAMYFFYLGYGLDAPVDWLRKLSADGKYVQIALEPNQGLDFVQADDYLLKLADDLRRSGAKIFLRYASEMNGPWVNYHGDPEKYVEKWKLITGVMRDRAPNVAMVWCPYATPLAGVEDYYPGDEYVDWVGVNLYNVSYFNQDKSTPAKQVAPSDMLRGIYDLYSDRKPIMICEYATTHFSNVEQESLGYFAANNILELYTTIRTDFPKIKGIYYFSSNNLKLAHRRNNNYSLLDNSQVLTAYRKVIQDPYFLSKPDDAHPSQGEVLIVPFQNGAVIDGRKRVTAWVDSDRRKPRMEFILNGKTVQTVTDVKDWYLPLDSENLPSGQNILQVKALSIQNEVLATKTVKFSVP